MANTYTLIEAKTLGSAVASVTFSSIPSTYTDLKLVLSARSSFTGDYLRGCYIRFNSDTTDANYSYKRIYINDAQTGANSDSSILSMFINADGATANTFGNAEMYLLNYTSSNAKSVSIDMTTENNGNAKSGFAALLWSGTAAINSILITPEAGDLMVNSTFYLYGISNS
jgi:hypothetical protein